MNSPASATANIPMRSAGVDMSRTLVWMATPTHAQ